MIRESIDEALVAEWQRCRRSANTGRPLFAVLDRAGEPWIPEDVSFCGRMEMVPVTRYVMGHCHLGPFEIPCEDELGGLPFVWGALLGGPLHLLFILHILHLCGTYGFDGWMLGAEGLGTCGG